MKKIKKSFLIIGSILAMSSIPAVAFACNQAKNNNQTQNNNHSQNKIIFDINKLIINDVEANKAKIILEFSNQLKSTNSISLVYENKDQEEVIKTSISNTNTLTINLTNLQPDSKYNIKSIKVDDQSIDLSKIKTTSFSTLKSSDLNSSSDIDKDKNPKELLELTNISYPTINLNLVDIKLFFKNPIVKELNVLNVILNNQKYQINSFTKNENFVSFSINNLTPNTSYEINAIEIDSSSLKIEGLNNLFITKNIENSNNQNETEDQKINKYKNEVYFKKIKEIEDSKNSSLLPTWFINNYAKDFDSQLMNFKDIANSSNSLNELEQKFNEINEWEKQLKMNLNIKQTEREEVLKFWSNELNTTIPQSIREGYDEEKQTISELFNQQTASNVELKKALNKLVWLNDQTKIGYEAQKLALVDSIANKDHFIINPQQGTNDNNTHTITYQPANIEENRNKLLKQVVSEFFQSKTNKPVLGVFDNSIRQWASDDAKAPTNGINWYLVKFSDTHFESLVIFYESLSSPSDARYLYVDFNDQPIRINNTSTLKDTNTTIELENFNSFDSLISNFSPELKSIYYKDKIGIEVEAKLLNPEISNYDSIHYELRVNDKLVNIIINRRASLKTTLNRAKNFLENKTEAKDIYDKVVEILTTLENKVDQKGWHERAIVQEYADILRHINLIKNFYIVNKENPLNAQEYQDLINETTQAFESLQKVKKTEDNRDELNSLVQDRLVFLNSKYKTIQDIRDFNQEWLQKYNEFIVKYSN